MSPDELAKKTKTGIAKWKEEKEESAEKKELRQAYADVHRLQGELDALKRLDQRTPSFYDLPATTKQGTSESAAVLLWSDWHREETVRLESVGGKNEYSIEIGRDRVNTLFEGSYRMVEIAKKDTTINHVVLALLGDFFTGNIHEDPERPLGLSEVVDLVEDELATGIRYLLDRLDEDTKLTIVTASGNHGRMTKKQMHATEHQNSLEQVMYIHLRKFFSQSSYGERINWVISEGYHSNVRLFDDYTIRFHHGHNLQYNGGIGGITIPVNKAIGAWNRAERVVPNLDAFGHFHTSLATNNFVANGSLIGYNAYALSIKAEYEAPSQTFFLVNKGWNERSLTTKLFVDPKKR